MILTSALVSVSVVFKVFRLLVKMLQLVYNSRKCNVFFFFLQIYKTAVHVMFRYTVPL